MSILRVLIIILIIFFNFILQNIFLNNLQIFNIVPNIEIIIIISFSLLKYEIHGAIIGFFFGLLHDIIWSQYIGIHSTLYMLVGYFSGNRFKSFYRENYIIPLILVFFGSLFYNIFYYIFAILFKSKLSLLYYLKSIILPETFYNIAITIPLYKIIYILNRYLEKLEEPKRKLF